MHTYHIIVLVACEVFSKSIIDNKVLHSLYDNRQVVGFVQCKDFIELVNTSSRDCILYHFLNYYTKLQLVILVMNCLF